MKETTILSQQAESNVAPKKANPFLEKLSNIFFGLFVTFLFTLPVWCILFIVVYFLNRM